MAEYDGSVRINTEIEAKNAAKELKNLERSILKTADKIASLQTKMDALKDVQIPTQEYKEISAQIEKAEAELNKLLEKQEQMQREGRNSGVAWERLNYKMEEARNTIRYARDELRDLVDSGKAFTLGSDTEEYTQMAAQMEQLNQQMLSDTERQTELQSALAEREEHLAEIRENAVVGNQRIIETVKRIKELEQEISDLKTAGITEGYKDYDSRIQKLEQLKQEVRDYGNGVDEIKGKYERLDSAAKSAFERLGSVAKSAYKKLGSIAKSAFEKLGSAAKKAAMSSAELLSKGIKILSSSIIELGKGIQSLYAHINKFWTAIKEGFTNMANEVDGFKAKMDSLQGSTLTLKNSIAAAFRPLVEVAIPYIQMVADALLNLLDMVGQFTAAITGQKTYTKAIKQTTAAIEDENAAQNKQLSGLDKLNNLSSGSGGSADSGASTQMFEENVPISSGIMDSFQKMKVMVESENWKGIGEYIADALNSGMQKVYDILSWDNMGEKVTAFITAFTGIFNSLVDKFDWEQLGRIVGTVINTIVNTLNLLIDGINWKNLGSKISTGFRGMLDEIDWTNLGNFFGSKFMILWDMLSGFINDMWKINDLIGLTGWSELGISIAEALNGIVEKINLAEIGATLGGALTGIFQSAIDFSAKFEWETLGTNIYQGINTFFINTEWSTVGKGISDFVMGILDTILIVAQEIDWLEVGRSIVDFILGIDWIGLVKKLNDIGIQLILGILEGILGIMDGIGKWLLENVFVPIIEWVKELFGIHSPSTVMAEMGTYIMEGLIGGIKSLIDTVVETIQGVWDGIKEVFEGFLTFFEGVFTGDWEKAWDGIVSIFESIKGTIGNIVDGIIGIVDGVIETISTAIQAVKDFKDSKGSISGVASGAFSSFNGRSAISTVSTYSVQGLSSRLTAEIPKLATGTVVPPNNEFLAVLGDNKREPEVVSPISTIEEAVENVLKRNGGMGGGEVTIKIPVEIDGRVLFELMKKFDMEQYRRTGRPSFQM